MYIQDQVNITDKFQVRFGGRIDKFEQEIQNRLSDPVAITSQDDTQFSPQLGAVYLLDDIFSSDERVRFLFPTARSADARSAA